MSENKSAQKTVSKEKKASLERLKNSYHQALTNGDTAQAKLLKAIIDRVINEQNKSK